MAFTVQDFHDLIELLEQHPEWRADLRRLVLTEEVLSLPQIVRDLAEAQRHTEQRVTELTEAQRHTEQRVTELAEAQRRTEQRVTELTEAQRRTEQRVTELTEAQRHTEQRVTELAEAQRHTEQRVTELAEAQRRTEQRVTELAEAQRRTEQRIAELAEAQRRTEQRIAELAEAQRHTEQRIAELTEAQHRTEQRIGQLQDDVGGLKGFALEERYHRRAPAYFSRLVRRSRVIAGNELAALLEPAVAQDTLSEDSADEIGWADLVVRGQRRDDGTEIYLVVEISWGLGVSDVERAVRRAALLAQIGVRTLPVVAGDHIVNEAAELCRARHVWQVLDGQVISPGAP